MNLSRLRRTLRNLVGKSEGRKQYLLGLRRVRYSRRVFGYAPTPTVTMWRSRYRTHPGNVPGDEIPVWAVNHRRVEPPRIGVA